VGFFALLDGRGAREDEHFVGHLRGRDPDFLAAQDVVVAGTLGARLEARGVQAGVGFGDGEAGFLFALDQRRQHATLLIFGAEDSDRLQAENIHVHRRCARQSSPRL